jgi:hypothetical protein
VSVRFTEANLVPNAGLVTAAVLAQRIGLGELVDRRLRLACEGANSGAKAMTVVGLMLASGDNPNNTTPLLAGAAVKLFDDTRAPSTVGSWLRAHKWSNVRELDAVSRELLARLWAAGAGPTDLAGPLTFDLNSSIVPVYGRSKQDAAFGYPKVRPSSRCSRPGTTTRSPTFRPGDMLKVEADHRRHAVVEQRIAELESAGLAHLPSSSLMAYAAWLA